MLEKMNLAFQAILTASRQVVGMKRLFEGEAQKVKFFQNGYELIFDSFLKKTMVKQYHTVLAHSITEYSVQSWVSHIYQTFMIHSKSLPKLFFSASGLQFIAHTTRRVLEKADLGSYSCCVDTKAYETFLKLVEDTFRGSSDLYLEQFLDIIQS